MSNNASTSRNGRPPRRRRPKNRSRQDSFNPAIDRRLYNPAPNGTLSIVRWVDKGAVTSTSAAPGLYGFVFQLSELSDYTSFTNVFDQFKITQVEVTFRPLTLPSAPSTAPAYAFMWFAVDYDDANTPASVAAVTNYSNAVVVTPGRTASIRLVPTVNTVVNNNYTSTLANSGGIQRIWVNTLNSDMAWNGLKVGVAQSTSTNVTTWRLFCRYHISFQSCR